MGENNTILRECLQRAQDADASWNQTRLAAALSGIAAEKGYKGFSQASVSNKLNDAALHKRRKYYQYKVVLRTFAEKNAIQIQDILDAFETEGRTTVDTSRQAGIWQLLMRAHTKQTPDEREPSQNIRRCLVKFEETKAVQVGITTSWSGNYTEREGMTFIRFVEDHENVEMMIIGRRPVRKFPDFPSYQRGICLDAAFGRLDYPHHPIVSGRCVFRRLDALTEQVRAAPEYWSRPTLKGDFCGYAAPADLTKRKLASEELIRMPLEERIVKEQYWKVAEIIGMLDDEPERGNFGSRIFLRD